MLHDYIIQLKTIWLITWVTWENFNKLPKHLSITIELNNLPVKVYLHSMVCLCLNHPLATQGVFIKGRPTRRQQNTSRSCEMASTWSYRGKKVTHTRSQREKFIIFSCNCVMAWAQHIFHRVSRFIICSIYFRSLIFSEFLDFIHKHLPLNAAMLCQSCAAVNNFELLMLQKVKIIIAWSFIGEIQYIYVSNDAKILLISLNLRGLQAANLAHLDTNL